MKRIILLALTALMMVGCGENENKKGYKFYKKKSCNILCVVIDSCEYIVNTEKYAYAYTEGNYTTYSHKGNCRFCKERRQKELEELVIRLKEE